MSRLDEALKNEINHWESRIKNEIDNLVEKDEAEDFSKEFNEQINRLDDALKAEFKKWVDRKHEEQLEKERLYKEFTTSSANATEDYFKTLDTTKEVSEWNSEKEKLIQLISSINKQVEELKESGKDINSVIETVESNLESYKNSIEKRKNSKDFWRFEMWSYWLEDVLANLKKQNQ
ncbi:hypothetical protein MNF30_00075 [Mycoplasma mycoides subsp. capri]|uniref:hypothetical protein n=1 Tax=Mycoplasma mycoides TaxID=2102 RepID=UPI00223F214D|nr:hypothetical protein [Mycoplasma mycoides]UZK64215.1 hypothetical protein MNF30_00075 [Mycoplasma mycoides subsp. capri]